MDRKANQTWAGSMITLVGGGGGGGGMKRSESQLVIDELFAAAIDDQLFIDESDQPFGHGVCSAADLPFHFGKSEMMQWAKDFTNYNSSASPAVDSPLSVVSSPNSNSANPKAKGSRENKVTIATSGSSNNEQSEECEAEPDGNWQCEESADPVDIRRNKRKRSNRDSARRSRRRKQAHLAELEKQVEEIRVENATLFKQLMDANQQYKDATTNNRVLKSDVAALRANVELAQDMVARGPALTTSSWSNLLKNHLSMFEEPFYNIPYPCRVSTGNFTNHHHRDHGDSPLAVPTTGATLENMENFHGNFNNNSMMSSISDNWPWETRVPSSSD